MITFRNYPAQAGITEAYYKVRSFLVKLGYSEYSYVRWDWMVTHGYLEQAAMDKIGLWEQDGQLVGLATFDLRLERPLISISISGCCGWAFCHELNGKGELQFTPQVEQQARGEMRPM